MSKIDGVCLATNFRVVCTCALRVRCKKMMANNGDHLIRRKVVIIGCSGAIDFLGGGGRKLVVGGISEGDA